MSKGKAIGLIISLFIVLLIAAGIGYLVNADQNSEAAYLKRGCEPAAWNQYGTVTIWKCPVERSG